MSNPKNNVGKPDASNLPKKEGVPRKPQVLDMYVKPDGTLGFQPRAEKPGSRKESKGAILPNFVVVKY